MLKFSKANQKLVKISTLANVNKTEIVSFDLPAGFTCPAAHLCQAYANRETGKITDGKHAQFRCYAASSESAFKNTRLLRWHNFDMLKGKTVEQMTALINSSLPVKAKIVRIHSSGDFFTKDYFQAWVNVAKMNPDKIFFGYTKILPYVKAAKSDNFRLVYSFGGKMDSMVTTEPVSYVVNSISEAVAKGLQVSCELHPADDYNFVMAQKSFALVVHGTQPAKKKGGK